MSQNVFLLNDEVADVEGKITKENLPGVSVTEKKINVDDRGVLVSLIRFDDDFVTDKIEEAYMVFNYSKNTVRGFHAHYELIDWFSIVKGSAKFVLFDARKKIDGKDNKFFGMINEFVLSDKHISILTVPVGVYHGWMSLEDGTILSSVANRVYSHAKPDEHRVPPESFGYKWGVIFK